MISSNVVEYDRLPPEAESTFEGHRAFGYDLSTAIADLVDNSITAEAANVWIDFHWAGTRSVITVTDDGKGMNEDQLLAAMRLSSRNPREIRAPSDLGRFGLGLKTASLSQCRRFTVRTKKDQREATRCWDLAVIAETKDWRLLRNADDEAQSCSARLDGLSSGTAVVWQNLDRLTANTVTSDDHHHQSFLRRIDAVRTHLSLVFHRIGEGSRRPFRISVNGVAVRPWDPFLQDESATYEMATTRLRLGEATVDVKPFVLPHLSKLAADRRSLAAGPGGWNSHQGFYIYRNRRLLVAGTWLGLFPRQDLYRLARIQVDLPNSVDHLWQIDVTKSKATPPSSLIRDLELIGRRTREEARHVFAHRGARLMPQHATEQRVFLWEPMTRHHKTFYRINRSHPLVEATLKSSKAPERLDALLRLVEESVPVPHITLVNGDSPDQTAAPFEGVTEAQVRSVLEQIYLEFRRSGRSHSDSVSRLSQHPPFDSFPEHIAAILDNPPHA